MSLGTENGLSVADIAAVTDRNNGNCGGWGGGFGEMLIAMIMLFLFPMFFGGFGGGMWGGMGGWGNGGMIAAANGALTRADLCSEFNFNGLENAVRGVQQGICDSTFALNNSINGLGMNMMQGFHGVDNAVCNLGFTTQQGFNAANVVALQNQNALQAQLSDCCCTTQRAIDGVNYNMATNTCALQNTMNNNTRDIIDNANANSRAILDYLCQDKISTLQSENQALRLAASQSAQNATLMAAMDANKADILRRTGAECPTPAYVVQPPTPVNFPTNCCGQFNGWNSGCNGCGC